MPVSELHRQVATTALDAGCRARVRNRRRQTLLAHGIITRPTSDVDLFSNRPGGVQPAVWRAALRAAGLVAERRDLEARHADTFPGMGEGLAGCIVTASGGEP